MAAPLLVSQSPTTIDALHPLAPPLTPGHLLGTDQFGRDVLARILYGGRIDLAIAFGATIVTLVGGTIIGLVAGYLGGRWDSLLMRIVDLFFAVPVPGAGHRDHRDARAEHLQHVRGDLDHQLGGLRADHARPDRRGQEAAVRAGRPRPRATAGPRVMFRHILPNTASAVIIFSMVDAVGNIILAASLGLPRAGRAAALARNGGR